MNFYAQSVATLWTTAMRVGGRPAPEPGETPRITEWSARVSPRRHCGKEFVEHDSSTSGRGLVR
jgi:hypothetical protein